MDWPEPRKTTQKLYRNKYTLSHDRFNWYTMKKISWVLNRYIKMEKGMQAYA
jgi:hypothetical protein